MRPIEDGILIGVALLVALMAAAMWVLVQMVHALIWWN